MLTFSENKINPTSNFLVSTVVAVTSAFGLAASVEWMQPANISSVAEYKALLSPGAQVARLRESSGLSTDQLAKLFGVTRRSVHNWINGHRMANRHQERLNFLNEEIRALPGETPEEKRNSLFYSVESRSPYQKLIDSVQRKQRIHFKALTTMERLS